MPAGRIRADLPLHRFTRRRSLPFPKETKIGRIPSIKISEMPIMIKTLKNIHSGLLAVGQGLDMVLMSMFLFPFEQPPPNRELFFMSDWDALRYDWQSISGDMRTVCRDLKEGVKHVH